MAGSATFQMVSNIGLNVVPSKSTTAQSVVNVGLEGPEVVPRTTPAQGWGTPVNEPREYLLLKQSAKAVAYLPVDVIE